MKISQKNHPGGGTHVTEPPEYPGRFIDYRIINPDILSTIPAPQPHHPLILSFILRYLLPADCCSDVDRYTLATPCSPNRFNVRVICFLLRY